MRRLPKNKAGKLVAPTGTIALDLDCDTKGRKLIRQERKYELITPLFGGGVEPGENDNLTPINGKGIRGHLRFWWRATRGGQFGGGDDGLRKMKEYEDLIWGAASTPNHPRPSPVQIIIECDSLGDDRHPFTVEQVLKEGRRRDKVTSHRDVAPPYASFPLQPPERGRYAGMPTKSVRQGLQFTLKITFPETMLAESQVIKLSDEVEPAIWGWENFGGIGARTRRGFGALRLLTLNGVPVECYDAADVNSIAESIERLLSTSIKGTWHVGVPHLSADVAKLRLTSPGSVNEVWNTLIDKLRSFRQMRGGTEKDPGRSKWPEPDQIRDKTDQMLLKHQDPIHEKLIYSNCMLFPRAVFGLPIAFPFHFQQSNQTRPHSRDRDPAKTKLTGIESDRWASQLILRPIACKGGRAVGLALILESAIPTNLQLIYEDTSEKVADLPVQTQLTQDEATEIEPLGGNKDVLAAFLKYLG